MGEGVIGWITGEAWQGKLPAEQMRVLGVWRKSAWDAEGGLIVFFVVGWRGAGMEGMSCGWMGGYIVEAGLESWRGPFFRGRYARRRKRTG